MPSHATLKEFEMTKLLQTKVLFRAFDDARQVGATGGSRRQRHRWPQQYQMKQLQLAP
jgi:hypothetical protein